MYSASAFRGDEKMNLFDFIRNTFVKNEPVWNYYGTNVYTDPIAAPEQ